MTKTKIIIIILFSIKVLTNCSFKEAESQILFEENIKLNMLDKELVSHAKSYEALIIHKIFNEPKFRTEYRMFTKKNNNWSQALYYSDSKSNFQKVNEFTLSELDAKVILLNLRQNHLFDIETMDTLLAEHHKLCGSPFDPSHYLIFELILISGKSVRKLRFENPDGRYVMCPAIKNWENATKLNMIFMNNWKIDEFQ